MKNCLLVSSILMGAFSWAQDPYAEDIAEKARSYIAAYEKVDVDTMATFYRDDTIFEDPTYRTTSGLMGEPMGAIVGKAKISQMLTALKSSMLGMQFEIREQFITGRHAVFVMQVTAQMNIDDNLPPLTAQVPLITVLEFEKGFVVHHQDFADYRTFFQRRDEHRQSGRKTN
ncbi:MAG: nuclear transport factor 2 family protein [Acidobacteria bacterium]|nr:nuclear transport factor 2 family protein [Acidobacteriota bacterium]